MRNLLLLLVPTALLYGCVDPDSPAPPPVITPAGYRLHFTDRGSMAIHDVYTLLDQAVEDAAVELYQYGITYEQVVSACLKYTFYGVDHFLFGTTASSTGYASGMIGGGDITLAFYSRQRNTSGPEWTIFDWGGGNVQSGIVPQFYPALSHELLHHFGYHHSKTTTNSVHVTSLSPEGVGE